MTKRQKSNSSSTIITPSSSSMIDQEAYRIALVKLFMALELSFRMVEHEAFQEFVRIIAPSFVVISHTTLAWDILSLWSSEKLIVESFDGEGGELTCKLRDKVESSLRSLFEKYNYGGDEFEVSSLEARARPSERVKNDPYGYSRYFQSTRSSTSKLDIYLEDASDSRLDLDVLNWWKLNSDRFPTLACMARDVLVIPISTMAFEFAFSIRGRVLDPYRCSLTPQMVEELVCTQDWIKRTPSPLPSNENEEFLEFKRIEEVHVEEHKNQLHLLLRVEKFSPSQIDAISGVLLLISCPLEWGAPTFDAGHAFGMVAYKAASRLTSATPPPAHVLSCGIGWQGIEILLNGLFGTLTGSIVSV
ncbi:hypothetical protein JHK84_050221 [Glycine max]|nr:hypothetical protein JHK84_050221 [Glycine max]